MKSKANREDKRLQKLQRRRATAMRRLVNIKDHLSDADRPFADSLIAQFEAHARLTDKQWTWVSRLAETALPSAVKPTAGPCQIYAIAQQGGLVKIGISKDPPKRMRGLQNANGSALTLLWAVPAPTRTKAKNIERRIHRHFRALRKIGEWFVENIAEDAEYMALVMANNTASGDKARWPSDPAAEPAAPRSVITAGDPESVVNTGGSPSLRA